MFYLYDIHGLRFQGTMENLENKRKVEQAILAQKLKKKQVGDENQPSDFSLAADKYRRAIKKNSMEPLVHAHQIMNTPVQAVQLNTPLIDAWKVIQESNIRQLPVVDQHQRILGVVADKDIMKKINLVNGEILESNTDIIHQIISEEVISCNTMTDIRRIARIMAVFHTGAIPIVIEEGRVVGIVTRGDILRGFVDHPRLNLYG